jgi:hypothetical protein
MSWNIKEISGDEDVTMTRTMCNNTAVAVSRHCHKHLPGGKPEKGQTIHSYTDSNHSHITYFLHRAESFLRR